MSQVFDSFDVDQNRAAFALDGFSDETLTQLRDAIDAIMLARRLTEPISCQPCDSL